MTESYSTIEQYSPDDLDRFAAAIARGPYVHPDQPRFQDPVLDATPVSNQYPKFEDRLFADTYGLRVTADKVIVPYGPWAVENHPNRPTTNPSLDPEVPSDQYRHMPEQITQRLLDSGHTLFDQFDRPVHPNYRQLLIDQRIGLPTGIGFFWKYGENNTVDAVSCRQNAAGDPEILLIQRRIGRDWALPGGFVDPGESIMQAARRELNEETSLDIPAHRGSVIHQSRPIGPRTTLNAWTRNTVVLLEPGQDYAHDVHPVAKGDAIDARWFTPEQMEQLPFFEDHRYYITIALGNISSRATAVAD